MPGRGIERRRRRPVAAARALAMLFGMASCARLPRDVAPVEDDTPRQDGLQSGTAERSVPTTPAPAQPGQRPAPAAIARRAQPVGVEIPAIGVSAPLVRLGLTPDGRLAAPESWSAAGWWTGGPKPGENGPAVIAGHVDSKSGPAVFYQLRKLGRGDRVIVTYSDRSTVSFAVERIDRHPKGAFPTAQVYGGTSGPTLRLITCGGEFDRSSGHYRDNVIVFASMASS
jgi:hypothetical protein